MFAHGITVAVIASVGLAGCTTESKEHAPVLGPAGIENAATCDQLNAVDPPEVTDAGVFVMQGRPAGCVVNGQSCMLFWGSDRCDAMLAVASCKDNQWRFVCSEVPLSTQDEAAGADGPADAAR